MKVYRELDKAGHIIWRVAHYVAGRRVRRTFHTEKEAAEWASVNRSLAQDEGRAFARLWLGITNEERHELMDALSLMRGHREKRPASRLTLVKAAKAQIAITEEIEESLLFSEAVESYLTTKTNHHRKGSVSQRWLNVLGPCLRRVVRDLPSKTLAEFSTEEIEEYLDDQDCSKRTFNNYRDYLHGLFKWGVGEKYLKENPIAKIEKFAKKLITTEVIVPAVPVVARILKIAQLKKYRPLQPALNLGFGVAMRSSEISGMTWENITSDVIHVPATIAKSGMARNIALRPLIGGVFHALLAQKGSGPIMPKGWRRELTNLFEEAGLDKPRNIMRKTGGSYHFHATGDEPVTQDMMGHAEDSNIFTSSYKALNFANGDQKTPISRADGITYYCLWKTHDETKKKTS